MGFGQRFVTTRLTLVRPPDSETFSLNEGIQAAPVISNPIISTNSDGVESVITVADPATPTNSDGVESVITITLTTVVQVG